MLFLLKVSDNSFAMDFGNALKNKKRCIIFVLDNASQINKLIDPMTRHARRADHIKNIVLISDEGDTIAKDIHLTDEYRTTAVSQKLWIELQYIITNSYRGASFKRLFVTVTIANICRFYGIKKMDIIQLLPPPSYSGHHDIEYNEIEDTLDIPRVLLTEAIRIYESDVPEAIIVSSERMITSQENLVASIAEYCRCTTIHTYNGSNMVVYTTSRGLIEKLTSLKTTTVKTNRRGVTTIKTTDVSYRIDGNTLIIKNCKMAVGDFTVFVKKHGERVVITIGKDLVTRAVSFVSCCEDNQLCATTSNYFFQKERMTASSGSHKSTMDSWNDPNIKRRLFNGMINLNKKIEYNEVQLRSAIRLYTSVASQFNVSVAKFIYEYFDATNILDFSVGWGDRLVAFLSCSKTKSYIGIDPNINLAKCYNKLIKNTENLISDKKEIKMIYAPAETVDYNNFKVDLIFTSPPVFQSGTL
jgi:hypothetical protein